MSDKGFFEALFSKEKDGKSSDKSDDKDDKKVDDKKVDDKKVDDKKVDDKKVDDKKDFNWRENLSDNEKKELLEFETLSDFVKDYLVKKQTAVQGVKPFKGSSYEEFKDWMEKADIEKKYQEFVKPEIEKSVLSELNESNKKEKEENLAKNKELINSKYPNKEELDSNLGAVIVSMGLNSDEFTKLMGDKLFQPEFIDSLFKLGEKLRSENLIKMKEGKGGDSLPDNPNDLIQFLKHWNEERIFNPSAVDRAKATEMVQKIENKIRSLKNKKGG